MEPWVEGWFESWSTTFLVHLLRVLYGKNNRNVLEWQINTQMVSNTSFTVQMDYEGVWRLVELYIASRVAVGWNCEPKTPIRAPIKKSTLWSKSWKIRYIKVVQNVILRSTGEDGFPFQKLNFKIFLRAANRNGLPFRRLGANRSSLMIFRWSFLIFMSIYKYEISRTTFCCISSTCLVMRTRITT